MTVSPDARMASTVVVGGGQAGLATAFELRRRGEEVVVLEAAGEHGASWRSRWDSLRLFTPVGFDSLPGLPFPGAKREHPGKDDVADYLARYAEHHGLPVELGTRVHSAYHDGAGFRLDTSRGPWVACRVVVATGAHRLPVVPGFAAALADDVVQLDSTTYRRPAQVPAGRVLVVGAGNSGAEIALDLATGADPAIEVHLAGRGVGHIPDLGASTYPLLQRAGRPGAALSRAGLRGRGDPLGRLRPCQLEAAGITRHPRVEGVREGVPLLADGRVLPVTAVIWCTGSRPDHSWLDPDLLDDGRLPHHRGVATTRPDLYVMGQPYQWSVTSHLLGGVGADARRLARRLTA